MAKEVSSSIKVNAETLKKIKKTVEVFLDNPKLTDGEIAEITGFSKSSVQRYLTHPIILDLYDSDEFGKIFETRMLNQIDGRRKGGMVSFAQNVPLKDEQGRFIGSEKYGGDDSRVKAKFLQIIKMARLFLKNPDFLLDDIAKVFEVTKDYVYDCFTVSYLAEILSAEEISMLKKRLVDNQNLGRVHGAQAVNERVK